MNASIFLSVNSKTSPLVATFTDKLIKKTIKYRNSDGHLFRLWVIKTQFLFTKKENTVEQLIDMALLGFIAIKLLNKT